jgi:hypothetical protein
VGDIYFVGSVKKERTLVTLLTGKGEGGRNSESYDVELSDNVLTLSIHNFTCNTAERFQTALLCYVAGPRK